MERMERVNSSFDLEYDYYRKNLPAIDDSEDTEESFILYEKIFDSRKTFTVLGLDTYIILDKKSLNKIANLINIHPQEYILYTNHQVIDEDKFDKILEKERDQLNPIFIPEPQEINDSDIDEGFKKAENIEENIINTEIFTRCLWLYLCLVVCSIWNLLFYIYIVVQTDHGTKFYSLYLIFLSVVLAFTGFYGFFKCRSRDFSGCTLKFFTFAVPCLDLASLIIYFASSFHLKGIWIKIIIDIITLAAGIALILYLFGLIKTEKINYDNEPEFRQKLINEKEDSPVYKF